MGVWVVPGVKEESLQAPKHVLNYNHNPQNQHLSAHGPFLGSAWELEVLPVPLRCALADTNNQCSHLENNCC